jgi:hypothetical protein
VEKLQIGTGQGCSRIWAPYGGTITHVEAQNQHHPLMSFSQCAEKKHFYIYFMNKFIYILYFGVIISIKWSFDPILAFGIIK